MARRRAPSIPPPRPLGGASPRWLTSDDSPSPDQFVEVDDRLTADAAYQYATRRIGMVWRGDYRNARQLLAALARRTDARLLRSRRRDPALSPAEEFHRYRAEQSRRARALGMLLVPVEPGFVIPLPRSPDVRGAALEAYPPVDEPAVVALRELLGAIGAHEWRTKGVPVPALGARVHPHYGVFAPTRGEYVDLVASAPLPPRPPELAFDIGTGTGVLAAVLANRGVARVVATDVEPRAVDCARENLGRLGMAERVEVLRADLFPPGRAELVVCNPPWLPARAHSALDRTVYDPGGRMLSGFLAGLGEHLRPAGEGWLVLSDLAELLGLRSRVDLLSGIEASGLRVENRTELPARHRAAVNPDPTDPLRHARAAEMTSLWRLTAR
jgi:SAM-dependent methyltransferase